MCRSSCSNSRGLRASSSSKVLLVVITLPMVKALAIGNFSL